jgi:hypothetical protein
VRRLTEELRVAERRGDEAAADAVKRQLQQLIESEPSEKAST